MNRIEKMLGIEEVSAHCDIPCGIYDPITAEISALTTLRMVDQMEQVLEEKVSDLDKKNKLARLVQVKENHAEKTKHEIRVIWGDFIKPAHVEKYPQIHTLVHEIMMAGSRVKQGAHREDALYLVEKVNEFAKIFWEIKGVKTMEREAPYEPHLKLVYPKLD